MRSIQMTLDLSLHIQRAVSLLRFHRPKDGGSYMGAFSGGKDSVVIKELARMAAVPVEWHYHMTTIDPPELLRFIREHHPDVIWDRPKHGHMLLSRARSKGVPSRRCRWCCAEYKEGGATDRPSILGVRIAESANRVKRWTDCVMRHHRSGADVVLPIRLWSDEEIWGFIHHYRRPYCSLYDEGFNRIGCVGCPLAGRKQRRHEWARWPRIYGQWRTAFRMLWERRAGTQDANGNEWFPSRLFDSWDQWFRWWDDGQGNVTTWKETDARPDAGV